MILYVIISIKGDISYIIYPIGFFKICLYILDFEYYVKIQHYIIFNMKILD